MKANEFVKKFGLDAAKHKADELKIIESMGDKLSFEDENLKRIVESHELVESKGGIELSKKEVRQRSIVRWVDPEVERLREAIADVEACEEIS